LQYALPSILKDTPQSFFDENNQKIYVNGVNQCLSKGLRLVISAIFSEELNIVSPLKDSG
jgi:hypothetical protein